MKDIKQKEFRVKKGKFPILFTAPHAVKHNRPSLKSSLKGAEPWTGYIAENLADICGGFSIVSTKEGLRDPNYFQKQNSLFKKEVERVCLGYKIKVLIDIHGLSDAHNYDFAFYWVRGFRKSQKLAYDIASALKKSSLKDSVFQFFNFAYWNSQETIGEFTTIELKVPTVQIEIARYIREDDSLRELFIKLLSEALLGRN